MKVIVLGCMLFGKGQGSKHDITVVVIDEVRIFKTKEEAEFYGDNALKNGGDSYFIYDRKKDIRWLDGNWELFKAMQVAAFFRDTKLSIDAISKKSKMHPMFVEIIEKYFNLN